MAIESWERHLARLNEALAEHRESVANVANAGVLIGFYEPGEPDVLLDAAGAILPDDAPRPAIVLPPKKPIPLVRVEQEGEA